MKHRIVRFELRRDLCSGTGEFSIRRSLTVVRWDGSIAL